MSRPLALFAIGLVFGGGVGFLVAASSGAVLEGHEHGGGDGHGGHAAAAGCEAHDGGHDGGHASHNASVEAEGAAPTLAISLAKDPSGDRWPVEISPCLTVSKAS